MPLAPRLRRLLPLLAGLLVALLLLVPAAFAASRTSVSGADRSSIGPGVTAAHTGTTATGQSTTTTATTTATAPGTPVLVSSMTTPPAGFRLTARQVLHTALADPRVQAHLRGHPRWTPYEYTKGPGQWQVSWFSATRPQKEMMQVYVSDATDRVTQVWTGFQVAWTMARGYPGAFGRQVNAWYLWIPLCILFVAPFLSYPRWRRRGRRAAAGRREGELVTTGARLRPSLFVLDLLMLLGFSISLDFFNNADIGLSVPLVYPFLIYLVARMLLLAGGRGAPRSPLRAPPTSWLATGAVFLIAFRIGLNVLNSNVIDVGYAGVIGATKLIHGHPLYGHWPADNRYGDTYGPVSYYLYVPFRLIFGWSGRWDDLPAAHAASIFFDLLTLAGLFVLGRRLRDSRLGVILVYLWAAFPFTLYAMNSNTNDSLVAATLVLCLLVISSAPARGVIVALAGMVKFAPLGLGPLFLRGTGRPPRPRSIAAFVVAFVLTVGVVMLPVLFHHNLTYFWRDSIEYQSNRVTPFSVWGLWGGLGTLQSLLQGVVVGLAVVVALVPGRRGMVEVAALGAAVLCALQITLNYWLYPYIVWFFPLVIVALVAAHPERRRGPAGHRSLTEPTQAPPVRIHIASP
ncbi:MAG TPA: hypothetical protein VE127_12760 [Solirubrobacteraceae bacterium]|nr:hypothetical protein [Solirubrobacteraceae bacterium]